MSKSQNETRSAPKTPSPVPIKRQYLVIYNASSLLLWSSLLGRIALIPPLAGLSHVYPSTGTFARNVQTLAIAEILHSLLGLVRAPVTTTGMQVASRLLLVWGIVWLFGQQLLTSSTDNRPWGKGSLMRDRYGKEQESAARWNQLGYLGMMTAWSVTECVRYGYFTFFLVSDGNTTSMPEWLRWARYNLFFVLYPLGISCECWLIWRVLPLARRWDWRYDWLLKAVLGIYVPGKFCFYRTRSTLRADECIDRLLHSLLSHDGAEKEGCAGQGIGLAENA